jgi:hypothetical protein
MQIKDRLSREQLKVAMYCTQKSFLDTSVSLNTRTSIILNLFKLYEEFKKRQMDGLQEISELFDCLTMFYQDLDMQLKIISEELSTLKTDIVNL